MKLNDIRKLAKEIRMGTCNVGYEELRKTLEEIDSYVSEYASGWTQRSQEIVKEEVDLIAYHLDSIKPEEPKNEAVNTTTRKSFKTVVKEMQGEKDPALSAIRWFSTIYAKDGYEKVRCAKGMLERRGYKVVWSGEKDARDFSIVGKHGEILGGFIGNLNGSVEMFEIYNQAA